MVEVTCVVQTNLNNAFFDRDTEDDFCDLMEDLIYDKVKDLEVSMDVEGIEGVSKVTAEINQVFTGDHTIDLDIKVDTELSEDEIADNDSLFDFIEDKLMPKFIEEFNAKCDVKVPVTNDDTFDDVAFDGENFFVKVYSAGGTTDYKVEPFKTLTVAATDDFEAYL